MNLFGMSYVYDHHCVSHASHLCLKNSSIMLHLFCRRLWMYFAP